MNFYFIFSLVPWRFWIIYILIIFTTLPWFFLDPGSLPNPALGPLSFCNPWGTVFTGHILLDVCPSTRTWSMYRSMVRKEAQLSFSLQLSIDSRCSVTGETLRPLSPRRCLSDWALHRSGASNQIECLFVLPCPENDSLSSSCPTSGSANHSAHSSARNLEPWWGRGVVWLYHLWAGNSAVL